MNDIEKAINLHKFLLDMAEYSRAAHEDFCGTADLTKEERKKVYDDMDKKINMHRAAISALEKQIPKKLKYRNFYQGYKCNCAANVPFQMQKYCCDCGQKLDWSVEDE